MDYYKMVPVESDPVAYFIPIFVLLIIIEAVISQIYNKELYQTKDAFASIGMGIGSVVINLLMKGLAFAAYLKIYEYRLFDIGWQWWAWVLVFFLDDFTFYWYHRSAHEVRILWAAHVNHHSSKHMNLATALRQSWGELFFKYFFWAWLPLIGFHPLMVFTMISISLIYQFWVHTTLINRFPNFFEMIFNTPSHHRVHHATNIRYLDKNHAGILIVWDRLFGTFEEERVDEKPIYGITTNIHTYNPFKIASHEYIAVIKDVKRAPTFKDKLAYIFMPPGWSHDGEDQRAKTLQKKLAASEK